MTGRFVGLRLFKRVRLASPLHKHYAKRDKGDKCSKSSAPRNGDVVVFALSGRITGEEVAGLHELFEAEAADRHLVLDLHEIKLVDRDVVTFLSRCEAGGIALKHCPAYIREWIRGERDGL